MECSKPQQMLGLRLMAKKELDAYANFDVLQVKVK